ncbi:MAG: HD domain-containing protein [Pseudobdellovibrio sp.]
MQWQYENFENLFIQQLTDLTQQIQDPSHDILHIIRVVKIAKFLATNEMANLDIVVPASYFHDCVQLPKNHPDRKKASSLSAEVAIEYLSSINYPNHFYDEIKSAIISHSFSANVTAENLEGKIVQDADRLDAIGAIGIARCFTVAGKLNRPYYTLNDPFCNEREPDDSQYTLDHFYKKLLVICDSLNTPTAQKISIARKQMMQNFLSQLQTEI